MSDSALTIEKVFEEVGWTKKWEARGEAKGEAKGEARGRAEVARNLLKAGFPKDIIVQATGISIDDINSEQ